MRWRGRGGGGRWRSRWCRVGCLLVAPGFDAVVVVVVVVGVGVHCGIGRMCAGVGVGVERGVV